MKAALARAPLPAGEKAGLPRAGGHGPGTIKVQAWLDVHRERMRGAAAMRRISGIITFAQEGRFYLIDDSGRHSLFILSPGADVEPQDLLALGMAQTRCTVAYEPARKVVAFVAHAIAEEPGAASD